MFAIDAVSDSAISAFAFISSDVPPVLKRASCIRYREPSLITTLSAAALITVAIDAANVGVYLAIARVEYRRGALDKTVRAYKKVLESTPNHQQALNDVAWILAEQGTTENLAEAEAFANRAVQRHPNNPSIRDTRGVVLLGLGRFQEAKVDLERCLTLVRRNSSTHAKALMHLGQVLVKLEQPRQARARLEEALGVEQERLNNTPDASPFFDELERGEINRLLSLLSEEPDSG